MAVPDARRSADPPDRPARRAGESAPRALVNKAGGGGASRRYPVGILSVFRAGRRGVKAARGGGRRDGAGAPIPSNQSAPSSPRKRGSREVGETVGREPRLRGKGGGG